MLADPWVSLFHLLEEGADQQIYTGAVALVGLKGDLLWEGAAGRTSRIPQSPPVTPETRFDLASLTKPLATALALMLLVDRGQLSLAGTLGEILGEVWLPPDKQPLSLSSLLAHRAGLPAWRPFYQEVLAAPPAQRPTLLERQAAATPLEYPPESATLYSDLGYMLLKGVIEKISGQNLDRFCRQEIYRPLGLPTFGFNPLKQPGGDRLEYAATEPGLIPGRNPVGEVHDENAWAAGGIAGHAGLFGTGREVFHLLAALYQAHQGSPATPFSPELVRLFFTPVPGSSRTLGFDTPGPHPQESAAGRYFSTRSVGHLGFTGASFWLDLAQGQMVVLLTNRVHLGRDEKEKIKAFRPRFQEAASRALLGRDD
ncbi:MAG: serine hydrolase domain-containing protein [Thermodesulfobacteriota bacterium]